MLEAMKEIALQYIASEKSSEDISENIFNWYNDFQKEHPEELFNYLVEDMSKIEKIYTLSPDEFDKDLVNLTVSELTEEKLKLFPFIKPTGSQSGQLGPVIKRTYVKEKGVVKTGPSPKIIRTTYNDWIKNSESDSIAASYFREILNILNRKKVNLQNKEIIEWKDKENTMLDFIIPGIREEKSTVLIAVKDNQGRYPGEVPEYLRHLLNVLRSSKYETTSTPGIKGGNCSLCEKENVKIYANGLKGAGINFSNVDREGSFNDLNVLNAWKNYALCGECADLLYIYKNYALKPFQCYIAGEKALILPFFSKKSSSKFMKNLKRFVKKSSESVNSIERRIWDLLIKEETILNINIFWVTVGQNIENLQGAVTDIPPSRLRILSQINLQSREWESPVFPQIKLEKQFQADLALNGLKDIFTRPGGKKNRSYNESKKLFKLRREIAGNIYHQTLIYEKSFWQEIFTTAELYLVETFSDGNAWGMVNEGHSSKGKNFLTFAGLIRHLAWFLYYFKKLEVMKMDNEPYNPQSVLLKPYFSEQTGIDSTEKAFAFVLGVLYGRLLTLQGAKGINVGANALTWLKRLTLKGSDLPELYVKVREKLLAYDAESNEKVREVIKELGYLGMQLGDKITLGSIPTNYFLLLGQSVSRDIIPSKSKED
jgi:CRISPR-associated protein Csh1